MPEFYNPGIETMDRDSLDSLIDERVRSTVRYAHEHSPFYRHWFRQNNINPEDIRVHEDLLPLPIVSGRTIRENQPPTTSGFQVPFSTPGGRLHDPGDERYERDSQEFFLTWDDWKRYAEKYARSFVSQGFGHGNRVVVCASYGMNVGANTMTLAAKGIGMTIIPFGRCDFASRAITAYRPTAIVGSVFNSSVSGAGWRGKVSGSMKPRSRGSSSGERVSPTSPVPTWQRRGDVPVLQRLREYRRDHVRGVHGNSPGSMSPKTLSTSIFTIRR